MSQLEIPQIATSLRRTSPKSETIPIRQDTSLPSIAALEDRSGDADDEGDGDDEVVSLRELVNRGAQPATDLLQNAHAATFSTPIQVPKTLDLLGPMSPLTELASSEDENDNNSNQVLTTSRQTESSHTPSEAPSPSTAGSKRKRSSSVTSIENLSEERTSTNRKPANGDDEHTAIDAPRTPKRARKSAPIDASAVGAPNDVQPMTPIQVKRSLRKHLSTLGTMKKAKTTTTRRTASAKGRKSART